jgi:hypothetical protein
MKDLQELREQRKYRAQHTNVKIYLYELELMVNLITLATEGLNAIGSGHIQSEQIQSFAKEQRQKILVGVRQLNGHTWETGEGA